MYTCTYVLEEWHDFSGQPLSCPEALGVQHHLCNQLTVRLGHGKTVCTDIQAERYVDRETERQIV